MMKKKLRRVTACLLVGALLLLQGCSSGTEADTHEADAKTGISAEPNAAGGESGSEKTMGRYVEEEVPLPDDLTYSDNPRMYLQKLSTGELVLLDQTAGMYLSSDNGESWSPKEAPWLQKLRDAYIMDLAIASDGSVATTYAMPSEETEESEEDGFHPVSLYISADGQETPLESPDSEKFIHRFSFGKDNRLYACALGGKVYEMNLENGTSKQIFETEGLSDFICFTDQFMIDLTSAGVLFYDMENGMLVNEDQVLEDFIEEHVGNEIGSYSDAYCVVMAEGEESNVIYFACADGLYRHVIGGTTVEQIMEGTLSSMGDPMMMLAGMAVLPDNEFVVLYTNGKLYRYVYNPDIPTVPEEQVSIYSLRENYAVRQAVSLFQKQHPEVYVRYEIGLNDGSGMTSEDAIKNLNTRMMSGSGPDLLVLDGLPRISYQEKGVLTDLSELSSGMTGEDSLFPNLVEACKEDGKLWYLPLRFRLPLIIGDPDTIQKVTDLASLADTVEELRAANPDGLLTGLVAEEEVLRALAINCSKAWLEEKSGAIDEQALTEFLTQAKRIYQAETAGMEESELEEYRNHYVNRMNWSGAMDYFGSASSSAISIAMGQQKLGLGSVYMMNSDFNMITTLAGQEENFDYKVWPGQITDGFLPKAMIGISSASQNNELALSFFHYLYGREVQDIEMSTGFPVNQASFETLKDNPRSDDEGISIGTSGPDGTSFSLDIKWCTPEDFEKIKQMAETASHVCTGDATIEEVVYEIGQKALDGGTSVEDTVKEIVKKVAIYLAE